MAILCGVKIGIMATISLVIVRHGNNFEAGEAARRIGAPTDLSLSASGQVQANNLGRYFAEKGWRFDRLFCSPLRRTRETAATILAYQDQSPAEEVRDFLKEIDHGPDENRRESDVVARLGVEAIEAWDQRGIAPADWIVDPEARLNAWQQILDTPVGEEDQRWLLVTSNGAARFALMAAKEKGLLLPAGLKLRTGSYGVITLNKDSAPILQCWGERP